MRWRSGLITASLVACGGRLEPVDGGTPDDATTVDVQTTDDALKANDATIAGTVIASSQSYPDAIAVDATNLYWADSHAGTVAKCANQGCSDNPTVLASGQWGMSPMTVDSINVYWGTRIQNQNHGPLMRCAIEGCAGNPTTVVASADPNAMHADGTSIYWTDTSGQVLKCAPDGSALTVLASAQNSPASIAVNAANVYWANVGDGTIVTCAIGGCNGSPTVLGSGTSLSQVAIDGAHIYWTTNGSVVWCPLAGKFS